jgi:hypothetical protein
MLSHFKSAKTINALDIMNFDFTKASRESRQTFSTTPGFQSSIWSNIHYYYRAQCLFFVLHLCYLSLD